MLTGCHVVVLCRNCVEAFAAPVHDDAVKLLRLRGRKVCDRVLRKGRMWKGRTMLVRWVPGRPAHPAAREGDVAVYAGTLASRALSKRAVERNRMRRRCREALRLVLKEQEPGRLSASIQLLLCPRSSSLHAPFALLREDIEQFLSALRSSCPIRNHHRGSSSSS